VYNWLRSAYEGQSRYSGGCVLSFSDRSAGAYYAVGMILVCVAESIHFGGQRS
jgi:hypothetical protein